MRASVIVAALLTIATAACRSDRPVPPVDGRMVALAGKWVQVYPAKGALDTLVLSADSSVGGSVSGLDSLGVPNEVWYVGTELMPDGLCIGARAKPHATISPPASCQGYVLRGDTLALANQTQTVYVRPRTGLAIQPLRRTRMLAGEVPPTEPAAAPVGSRAIH